MLNAPEGTEEQEGPQPIEVDAVRGIRGRYSIERFEYPAGTSRGKMQGQIVAPRSTLIKGGEFTLKSGKGRETRFSVGPRLFVLPNGDISFQQGNFFYRLRQSVDVPGPTEFARLDAQTELIRTTPVVRDTATQTRKAAHMLFGLIPWALGKIRRKS